MTQSVTLYRDYFKPLLDQLGAAALIVLLAPAFLLIAAAVRVGMGSPVLFTQPRVGKSGHKFRLIKFRTMTDATDERGCPLPDAARLTKFGRWLRSTSLDELPELWNVLRGEMSLVGPRPLLIEYLDRYTSEQARRHEVKPGLTGLAQVNGRNAISWEERFRLDVRYVDELSFVKDLKILVRTVACVYRCTGVSAPFHATMPPFGCTPIDLVSRAANS